MFQCVRNTDVDANDVVVQKKLVVVGDGQCGKTSLLFRFNKGEFNVSGYLPTVFDSDVTEVRHNKRKVQLKLFDTAGQEDYDRLRPFCYPDTDVILVCFSVDNPDSLENAKNVWVPEVRHFCGNVPILLVGTKSDLREDHENANVTCIKQGPVKYKDAMNTATKLGTVGYFECSAKMDEGVKDIFESAIDASMVRRKQRKIFLGFRKRGD